MAGEEYTVVSLGNIFGGLDAVDLGGKVVDAKPVVAGPPGAEGKEGRPGPPGPGGDGNVDDVAAYVLAQLEPEVDFITFYRNQKAGA